MGDINGDGTVSISDAVDLQKYLLGMGKLANWKNADICQDGVIDAFDMVEMRRLIIKK
ncbi:MAG: dockerin type I repeat-containing protein [Ruminococcus sp.]|nr:dockerin type I repeat-containing protein [Ruminococcus sp.]MDE6848825.1 dockerin type I repeat-containing protein [Ruminococcus sp.]MDE7137816.1 dockerin type I repeat-containing protein [Ruminococcus sp.]